MWWKIYLNLHGNVHFYVRALWWFFLWYGWPTRPRLRFISSLDHCQRSSPLQISDTLQDLKLHSIRVQALMNEVVHQRENAFVKLLQLRYVWIFQYWCKCSFAAPLRQSFGKWSIFSRIASCLAAFVVLLCWFR